MSTEEQINAVKDLARAVVNELGDTAWTGFALVADREPQMAQVSGYFGFLYREDSEWEPLEVPLSTLNPAFERLIAATCTAQEPGWIKALFQLEYPSGKSNLAFEHNDADRWKMVPPHWDALPNELRPSFDQVEAK